MAHESSRRTFLSVVAAGSAVTCLGGLSGCAAAGPTGQIAAGNISAIAEGESVAIAGQMVALFRDANGLWAVTTICTHLQCDMQEQGTVSPSELSCDCHASTFTPDGDRVSGPANRALDNFEVLIDEATGDITIDADVVVDAATRTAAPAIT
ncbi:MAG: Rieske 2Fe-2S domain-containing protein [Deltaproteobacteria bacterium]|nr:Rieske 2Fe-2S domain-containing protein [Deltaproteobacteria bacterium]